MAEQHSYHPYTKADIEQYLQGRMHSKQMHEMEKAALQDPFLADAIEGYSDADAETSSRHLNEITAALYKEQPAATVVELKKRANNWWRVAAAVIGLLGVGTAAWLLAGKSTVDEKLVAQQVTRQPSNADTVKASIAETPAAPASEPAAAKANNFSTQRLQSQKPVAANDVLIRQKSDYVAIKPVANEANKELKMPDTVLNDIAVNNQPANSNNQPPVVVRPDDLKKVLSPPVTAKVNNYLKQPASLSNQFNGRITDNNLLPVANAVVQVNNNQVAVLTDANGYFNLTAKDTVLPVTVSTMGYSVVQTQLNSNTANNIVVQPAGNTLNEVVVTQLNTPGVNKALANSYKSKADSSFPVGGWQSFQDYVYRKMHKDNPGITDSTDLVDSELTGSVDLEFFIDREGKPYHFKVIQANNTIAAQKAIDAIQSGPKWVPARKEKKARVVLRF